MSEEVAVFIKRGPLTIKKVLIRRLGHVAGEYLFIKRGLFEAEVEYDIEDEVVYYLQLCWLGRCIVWFEGEPDRKPPRHLLEKAEEIFREVAYFSRAALASLKLLASFSSRSSSLSISDLSHRPVVY